MKINETVLVAEQAIIGATLLVFDRVTADAGDLRPDHFELPWHGKVWEWANQVRESGRDVNPISVAEHAERLGFAADEFDFGQMATLGNNCPGSVGVKAYAGIIIQAWRDRQARKIAAELIATVGSEGDAVGTAITALMNLDREEEASELSGLEAMGQAYAQIERAFAADGQLQGVTTGFSKLDSTLGGWQPGDLVIVQARPSMGKTAWMLASARAASRSGSPVGIISAEQPASQIAMRQLAMQSGVKLQNLRSAKMETFEWDSVTDAMRKLRTDPVRIFDRSAPSLGVVASQTRKWVKRDGVQVVFVDYLQRLTSDAPNRREEVSKIARGLKTLARDSGVCVVALAQSVRDCDNRNNKRPGLADIAESSDCEREADTILSIYRDEVYDPNSNDVGTAELIVCKNRHGPTGLIKLAFNGATVRFSDLAAGSVTAFRGAA